MVGSCLLVGVSGGRLGPLWNDLMDVLTGGASDVIRQDAPLSAIVADSMAMAILTIPVMGIGILLAAVTGGFKSVHIKRPLFHECAEKKAPSRWLGLFLAIHKIASIVLFEEFYARWLFLGLLTQIAWLSGPTGFYLLFLAGNALWTAIHIANYVKGRRRIGVVIPVFCYGFIAVAMYLRHGLLGAYLAHIIWDLLIMIPGWLGQTLRKQPLTL